MLPAPPMRSHGDGPRTVRAVVDAVRSPAPTRRRGVPPSPWGWVAGLVAWSGFVWGNRLNNLVADDATAGEWAVSGTLSAISLLLSLGATVALVRAWRSGWPSPAGATRGLLQAVAGWSIGVWVVRGLDIAVDWRSVGFVVVHLVLAAVSIALGVGLLRGLGAPQRRPGDGGLGAVDSS